MPTPLAQKVLDEYNSALGRKVQFRNKWGWFEFLIRAALDGRFIPTSDLADHRAAQVQTQAAAPPVAGASPPARQHSAVWQVHQNELARLFPPSEVGINLSPLRALEDEHAIWLEALNSFVAERVRAQLTTDRNRNEAPYVTTASGSHRLKIGILSHPIPSMTKRHNVLATFRQMAEAFPHTFFAKSADVQPLKIGIATDLLAALPPGVEAHEVKRFLGWYVNRPVYLKALAQGAGRVDLTGAVVDTDIPEEVRSQAKQRLEAAQQGPATFPRRTGAMAKPAPAALLNLEELYAMTIGAKLEATLKFSVMCQFCFL